MRIWKSPWGEHIDLDHVQAVRPVYFEDRMGRGGYYAGFSIQYILQDKPVFREWEPSELGLYRLDSATAESQMVAAVERRFHAPLIKAWEKENACATRQNVQP
jgi:hypothetical protein